MKLIMNTRAAVAILMATAMIFSSILLEPLQASAADGSPTDVSVTAVGDVATISWVAPTVGTVIRYEYKLTAHSTPLYPLPIDSTYYSNGTILQVSASSTQVSVRLPTLDPRNWYAYVRAVIDGATPLADGDGWVVQGWITPARPTPTLTGNYQRIYQTEHQEYIPSISGISTEYSLVYAVGDKVLKATKLNSTLGLGITWQELSTANTVPGCSLSTTSIIDVYAVYLSAEEISAVDGCNQSSATMRLSNRKVGSTQFGFSIEPIPTASATFDIKQPPATDPVLKTIRWLDNETRTWASTLTLVGGGANSTAVEFLRWNNADGTPADMSNPPILGATYTAVWTVFSPLVPLAIQVAGQTFSRATIQESNYLTWSDNESTGLLPFSVNVLSGTNWNASLTPIAPDGLPLDAEVYMHHVGGNTSASGSFDIDNFCIGLMEPPDCPNLFKFEIHTFAPAPTTEDPDATVSKYHNFYLIRDSSPVKPAFTYQLDNSDNPTQLVSNDADPRWLKLAAPPSSWSPGPNTYFDRWCAGPNELNRNNCYRQGDYVAVFSNLTLYPRWIQDLEPTSIDIGSQSFNAGDWEFNPIEQEIYLTVQSSATNPLTGSVTIEGPEGVYYETDSDSSFMVETLEGNIMRPTIAGSYVFEPRCAAKTCAQIYVLTGHIVINGTAVQDYTAYIIAAPDTTATFKHLEFDATPGTLNAVDPESIDTRENQVIGWYPVPVVPDRSADFINYAGWEDTATDGEGYWEAYFPVIADNMKLSLDWGFGPFVSVLPSVTIFRGDSQVATASASFDSAPSNVSWTITGTSDFTIDEEGQITANPQLSAGSYSFSVVATDPIDPTDPGPPVQMTVTVVERSQVGSSENTNLPPTNQTGAGQHLPKPGSKLQADLISKVSRSKLAVGGTAQFGVTGGEPGATRVFASNNPRICSINARGLVTAKSTGVCLISATATAQDPVFSPASAPLTKIVVLGPGLINNAKVTELNGQVSIKASLLKSLAGKSVKLALEVMRAGKSVLVPMRREVLSKSATATFKSFAKPRPGTRIVLTIGGRAVYALTL